MNEGARSLRGLLGNGGRSPDFIFWKRLNTINISVIDLLFLSLRGLFQNEIEMIVIEERGTVIHEQILLTFSGVLLDELV